MSNPNTVSRFDEIFNSTKKPVLAYITAKCVHTSDIDDIFQETYMELFVVLLKRGTGYIINDRAFVLKLANQKLARYYKLLGRLRNVVSLTSKNDVGEEVDLSDFIIDDFLIEDFSVNNIMLDNARRYITSKPEIVKKVFYLYYDVELTICEIAQLLSLSESNVKNYIYRTLKEMRSLFI